MGQKVHPTGFRVGIMEDWRSRWYASKHEFPDLLVEDFKIRKFIKAKYSYAGIPKVEIERTRDAVTVRLFTARPGVIIGRTGEQVEKITEDLQTLTGRRIDIKIEAVTRPEIDAQLVSEDIAEQLKKRSSFRRTMKRALEHTMDGGALGVKIQLSGRLGGSEMSRTEMANLGSIPLSTLRAKIDYKKYQHDRRKAADAADDAEESAARAIEFALDSIDYAEYAVIDAVLARATADAM